MTDVRDACEGEALNAIITERLRQLGEMGHSRDADNRRTLNSLPITIKRGARALLNYTKDDDQQNLHAARYWAKVLGALAMAQIDRIDHELAKRAKARAKATAQESITRQQKDMANG